MTEGTIVKWNKNEGDNVAAGDVLCEIQVGPLTFTRSYSMTYIRGQATAYT